MSAAAHNEGAEVRFGHSLPSHPPPMPTRTRCSLGFWVPRLNWRGTSQDGQRNIEFAHDSRGVHIGSYLQETLSTMISDPQLKNCWQRKRLNFGTKGCNGLSGKDVCYQPKVPGVFF